MRQAHLTSNANEDPSRQIPSEVPQSSLKPSMSQRPVRIGQGEPTKAGIPAFMHPSMISWLPWGFDVTKTTSALHEANISFTSLIVSGRPPTAADSKSKYSGRKWAIRTLVLTIPYRYTLTAHMTTDEPRNSGPESFCLLRTYPYQIPTKTRDSCM